MRAVGTGSAASRLPSGRDITAAGSAKKQPMRKQIRIGCFTILSGTTPKDLFYLNEIKT